MSLSYRLNPFVRNNEIDSYELFQHLLDDNGIYILGNAVDYAKGPYRAFRVQLLLLPETQVPLCRLLLNFIYNTSSSRFISLFSFNLRNREIVNKLNDATFVGLSFFLLLVHLMGRSTAHHLCCSLFRFVTLHICNVKFIFICISVEVNSVVLFRLI
jgi:hypothetical protein